MCATLNALTFGACGVCGLATNFRFQFDLISFDIYSAHSPRAIAVKRVSIEFVIGRSDL